MKEKLWVDEVMTKASSQRKEKKVEYQTKKIEIEEKLGKKNQVEERENITENVGQI